MAAKRDDYFEAGTLAVWDVDPTTETVTLFAGGTVTVFHRGDIAHAEPVVVGWSMAVDAVFDAEA